MEFIKNNKIIITIICGVLLSIGVGFAAFKLLAPEEIDYENRDKRVISNVLLNAIDGGSIETKDAFYQDLVDRGFLTENVRDEYFNFEDMSLNTFWGRYDIGANKEISIRLNEKISENEEGIKTYLTVVSYRYPINKQDLGHDFVGEPVGDEVYYRVNKVLVSAMNEKGTMLSLTSFPESSLVSNIDGVGLELEDKHLFEEGMLPASEDYIDDLINGKVHEHEEGE